MTDIAKSTEDQAIARVLTLLFGLGSTQEAVAETLIAKGIKGVPGEECNCPIYNFLAAEGVAVKSVVEWELSLEDVDEDVPLPQAISEFIEGFDADEDAWPELVAPADEEVES